MLQIKSLIALLVLCSVTISSPVFGQTSSSPITVTTDKASYSDGSTIMISGVVQDQLNIPISIVIKDPSQHIVFISQVNPNSDNTYSTQAVAGGSLWTVVGTYEIDVTYGGKDRISKTVFEFSGPQTQTITNQVNQTNATQVIPEFGPSSATVLVVSILSVIILYSRARTIFRV